jgi:hypothetical protein
MLFNLKGKSSKQLKKIASVHVHKLLTSPKYRNEFKRKCQKICLQSGEIWDDAIIEKKVDNLDRSILLGTTSIAMKGLKMIKEIEENIHREKLAHITKRRFSIYLHKSQKKFLVELRFKREDKPDRNFATLIFLDNLNGKKSGGIQFDKKISKSGYKLIDSGSYFRKKPSWFNVRIIFRGKRMKIYLPFRYINKNFRYFRLSKKEDFGKIISLLKTKKIEK